MTTAGYIILASVGILALMFLWVDRGLKHQQVRHDRQVAEFNAARARGESVGWPLMPRAAPPPPEGK